MRHPAEPHPCAGRRRPAPPLRLGRRGAREQAELPAAPIDAADLLILAGRDAAGDPAAWPLAGAPGLAAALGPRLVRVRTPSLGSPAPDLGREPSLGLLALDLARGRSARLHGDAVLAGGLLTIAVDAPPRGAAAPLHPRLGRPARAGRPRNLSRSAGLDDAQLDLVARSDTVFGARAAPAGAVPFHRCGRPGFVSAASGWIGAAGLPADGPLCLVFIAFGTGAWLQLLVGAAGASGRRAIVRVLDGGRLPRRWV